MSLQDDKIVDCIIELSLVGNLSPGIVIDQFARLLYPDDVGLANDFIHLVMNELYEKRKSLPWKIDERYGKVYCDE